MAISFVGVNSNKGNAAGGTSITVNAPSGCQPGDMVFIIVSSDGTGTPSNAGGGALSPGTWTQEGWADSGRSMWWWKAFEAGDTTYTCDLTTNGTFDSYVIVAIAYRGVLNSDASEADWNNSSTDPPATAFTHTSGTVTNTSANNWGIVIFTSWRADGTKSWAISSPSWTERIDENETTASVDNASVAVYDSNGVIATGDYSATAVITTSQDRTLHAHIGIMNHDPNYNETPRNLLMLTGMGQ